VRLRRRPSLTPEQLRVARDVRLLREQRGLSLAELARQAGLAKQTLSNLEQGVRL